MHLALCDDHPIVADGIAGLLQRLDPSLVIERHALAASVLAAAPRWRDMDLVLLDLGLPDADGLATLQELRRQRDDVPVVVISGVTDRRTVLKAIDLGAIGYIPKTSSTQSMLDALRIVLDGGFYLPQESLMSNAPATLGAGAAALTLTPRQWEILRCILRGKSVKGIARDLDIAESTVKTHVTPILREMGVTTRTEAIVKAGAIGLRFPPEASPRELPPRGRP